jgi:hypothetical protein
VTVERANAGTAAVATPEIPGGFPDLTASQLDLIRERSTETVVDPGASLGNAGDVDYDFMLVEAGHVEVVRFAAFGLPEQVIATFGDRGRDNDDDHSGADREHGDKGGTQIPVSFLDDGNGPWTFARLSAVLGLSLGVCATGTRCSRRGRGARLRDQ